MTAFQRIQQIIDRAEIGPSIDEIQIQHQY